MASCSPFPEERRDSVTIRSFTSLLWVRLLPNSPWSRNESIATAARRFANCWIGLCNNRLSAIERFSLINQEWKIRDENSAKSGVHLTMPKASFLIFFGSDCHLVPS